MEGQKLAFLSIVLCRNAWQINQLQYWNSASVALFELNRMIWQDCFAFLWFILLGATFLVTYSILLSWNKENLLLNHTYAYRICGIDPYSMLLNYLLTKLEGRAQWPKIADSWTSLAKWLFLYKFTSYLQLFSFWLFLFLCQFLSWEKIWEYLEKIINTKSEPQFSGKGSILVPIGYCSWG